jgi:hypothetical protein
VSLTVPPFAICRLADSFLAESVRLRTALVTFVLVRRAESVSNRLGTLGE